MIVGKEFMYLLESSKFYKIERIVLVYVKYQHLWGKAILERKMEKKTQKVKIFKLNTIQEPLIYPQSDAMIKSLLL